jgi:2,4-dienoyl-CoA reductase-like NADH-dependent reductase (Old Yellow Enzyme family)/pyruvate/2-oxoglutarate dehydrogenase complex dihydrolipoamide dehydrogenase (E3) component
MKMYNCKYPHLFSPIQLGNTLFRNRIFASPTGVSYSDPRHRPINETICYYERKAKGGAASVCVGDVMVDAEHSQHGRYNMMMDDIEIMPVLNKLSSEINRHGAVATIELFHVGSAATITYLDGREVYGPQEGWVEGALGHPKVYVHAMDPVMMDRVIKKYVEGASLAKRCGFGMVLLHSGHGFLMHQFMSPTLNHRTDEYGGSFENRMRFPLEITKAVREAVGQDFPLELRISGSEVYEGGYGVEYGCRIAEAFDGIVDLIHVSAGSHEDARVFTVTHPSMFLEDGVNVKYAAEIKKHVKKSKVATVGALSAPELLEEIIASGKADVVELARGIICDPDLPNKARSGRDNEIRKCMRCFTCFSNLIRHGQIVCALNPEISDESEQKYERYASKPKKVLIAGGGVAGMEAALTSARRGHQVILCEKSGRLGGVLRCEDNVPFKKHLHEYLEQQEMFIARGNIEVRLNTRVTKEIALEIDPYVIITAVGSKPLIPNIPGINNLNVLNAEELYSTPKKAGKRIVILGGGLVGSELAIYLVGSGHNVTIMEMLPSLNAGDNILQGQAIGLEIKRLGIKIATDTKAIEINDNGVTGECAEGLKFFEADTIVRAFGRLPMWDEVEELRFCAPEFYQIGDCLAAKNIYEATRTAHHIAKDIGEH